MPMYDLKCRNCNETFNTMASMSDKTEKRIPCPECGSFDLETAWSSAPAVIKGNAAPNACPNSHICGAGCHHAS